MSTGVAALVSDNLDLWTSAIERKSGAGRGGGRKVSHYGIERLRALILDLAVSGKLVSQDAEDEPAQQLLIKIKSDRAELTKAKAIGKGKAFPPVSAVPPFAIPEGWAWVQLSDIGHDWGQAEPESDFTYIDVGSIDQKFGVVRSPTVLPANVAPSRARKRVKRGTVIYSTVRPYLLNIATIDQDFDPQPIASTAFAIVHPFDGVEAGYVFRYLRSPAFVRYVEGCQTGIAYPAINERQFFAAWFPLPPHAEQRRIVAKVDELMALCDALEAQSASALEAHQTLVETLLATLVNAADPADLADQWARLEGHFDDLFTTEASIDAMKQTVLELAVRGKLAKQNTYDEPASEFITRLAKEKSVLASSGSIRKPRSINAKLPTILPFPLPPGWEWSLLGSVCYLITDGEHLTPKRISDENGIPLVTAKNVRAGVMDYAVTDFVSRETAETCWQRCKPQKNDILLVSVGATIGRSTIVTEYREMVIVRSVTLIRTSAALVPFLSSAIGSQMMQRQIWNGVRQSAQPGLYLNVTNSLLIPIPPLAEQERIVAKLGQLMALCDTLKARLNDAAQTQKHLADAVVERAAA